jgi:hypothetical protein
MSHPRCCSGRVNGFRPYGLRAETPNHPTTNPRCTARRNSGPIDQPAARSARISRASAAAAGPHTEQTRSVSSRQLHPELAVATRVELRAAAEVTDPRRADPQQPERAPLVECADDHGTSRSLIGTPGTAL